MAHQQTITLKINGVWRNIPTVVGGKKLGQPAAKAAAIKSGKLGRGFKSVEAAVNAARLKSNPPKPKKKNN